MNATLRIERDATTVTFALTRAHCLDRAGNRERTSGIRARPRRNEDKKEREHFDGGWADDIRADAKVKVIGHDWGASAGAVYAMRYRSEVTHLAFLESALAGAGFESLWKFDEPNPTFTFVPSLLMGQSSSGTAVALFETWAPYVVAMRRQGIVVSSTSYYRDAHQTAEHARAFLAS